MPEGSDGTRYTYAAHILAQWLEVCELADEVRESRLYCIDAADDYVASSEEKKKFYSYVTKLIGLYKKILNKVKTRTDFGADFITKYSSYTKYCINAPTILDAKNIEDIFEMDLVVGEAIEKLKLLDFEQSVY